MSSETWQNLFGPKVISENQSAFLSHSIYVPFILKLSCSFSNLKAGLRIEGKMVSFTCQLGKTLVSSYSTRHEILLKRHFVDMVNICDHLTLSKEDYPP